jgi:hypothetical protein
LANSILPHLKNDIPDKIKRFLLNRFANTISPQALTVCPNARIFKDTVISALAV